MTLHNTEDHFAWIRPEGGFMLMRAEDDGTDLLLKNYSSDGKYLDNRLIQFPGMRGSWRETWLSLDGRIFSTRLFRGRFEIYEWK